EQLVDDLRREDWTLPEKLPPRVLVQGTRALLAEETAAPNHPHEVLGRGGFKYHPPAASLPHRPRTGRGPRRRSALQPARAHPHGAAWAGVALPRAFFSQADLSVADLSRANLEHARFWKARLCQARLRAANLTGANATDADLAGADLSEVRA